MTRSPAPKQHVWKSLASFGCGPGNVCELCGQRQDDPHGDPEHCKPQLVPGKVVSDYDPFRVI